MAFQTYKTIVLPFLPLLLLRPPPAEAPTVETPGLTVQFGVPAPSKNAFFGGIFVSSVEGIIFSGV